MTNLINNETFMNAIANATSIEQMQEIFAQQGVDVTEEELKSAVAMVAAKGDELDEACLENVSGGIALTTCYMVLNCAMVMMAGKPLWLLATM